MPKWVGGLLLAALVALFLVANRGAYGGYFQDDDLDTISWTSHSNTLGYVEGFLTPRFAANNFRPTGHLFYRVMGAAAGLRFGPYVAVLHVVHLLNVWLLWLVARRLGAGTVAAGAAALFFAFHMAAFDAYWRPQCVFDILCGLFCLLALLAYLHDRTILSLLAFWLAYKSKEIAVMLPAVLFLYEYWMGQRRWKRLIPFFGISLLFGLQAVFANRGRSGDYALHFDARVLFRSLNFYAGEVLLAPWAGWLLVPLPFLIRAKRLAFGIASAGLLLLPLLFLPGRMFAVYLYVPLIALALGLSALAERVRPVYVALFFLVWLGVNYRVMMAKRKAELAIAHENRAYVTQAAAFFAREPGIDTVIYVGAPPALHRWGVEGALRLTSGKHTLTVCGLEDREFGDVLKRESLAVLSWSELRQRLFPVARKPETPLQPFIRMGFENPLWQLEEGWFSLENEFRWIAPRATARLQRPEGARTFELTVNVSEMQQSENGAPSVEVLLDGKALGPARQFSKVGWDTARWEVPPGVSGNPRVEFRVTPAYRPRNGDPRTLGVAVVAFGFVK